MRIFIPTKGRRNQQLTLRNLPTELQYSVALVCPKTEAFWLKQDFPNSQVIEQPDDKMGIAAKRQWIIEQCATTDKIVMLDDDLRFAIRREDDPGKFTKALQSDILQAFRELEEILSPEVPHAGFSARGGGISDAAQQGGWQEGKRMMYVLGYHVPTVRANAIFGRLSTHEDMDVCLQLLTKGFPNKVNYTLVVDQKFGNKGGCTEERTVAINNADSVTLAELFPQFVRTTQKDYAGSTPRIEVVCSWVKALKYGLDNRK